MVALALGSAVALSGCAPAALIYHESRKVAKARVVGFLDEATPGKDHAITSECVIKAMSYGEILGLANHDPDYTMAADRALVTAAVQRPATLACEAAAVAPKAVTP